MNLKGKGIWLAQLLGLGMFVLVGCGSSSKGHKDAGDAGDAGDGGDGAALEVASGEAGEVGEVGRTEAGVDLGVGDALADAPSGDVVRDVASEPGRDTPVVDAPAVDAPVTDAAIDAPIGDTTRDAPIGGEAGEVGPLALIATLGGNEETPPVATTATGVASFIFDPATMTLNYQLVDTVVGATAAHIHSGAGGEAGPILFTLTPLSSNMTGIVTLTPDQIPDLLAGRDYINVHSTAFPAGEIRGQILMPGETLFVATLTGNQEAPPTETTGTGNASVILSPGLDSIKYHLHTSLTPTNAHIHTAIGGMAGPITIPFTPIASTIDGVASITPAQATDLAEGRMYVNVHTTAFPNGEIRGQLLLPGETLATANLSGANETPPVTTTASGVAAFILSYPRDAMRYEGVFTGLSGPATLVDLRGGITGDAGAADYPLTIVTGGAGIKGVQAVLPTDVAALNASPSALFVNVHTAAHPNGEIGGPVTPQ